MLITKFQIGKRNNKIISPIKILFFQTKKKKRNLKMKTLISISLILVFFTFVHGVTKLSNLIGRVDKTFKDLEKFCYGKNGNFCSRENMELSTIFILNIVIGREIEEMEAKKTENLRKRNRLSEKKMRNMFREHFLDRHI